ncbi:MAG: PD40 domain-containing protein [Gemmatimonadetes bacterium]|nr:PD40 domain-containing protein [Gemmatimonadota bacterium]
MLTALIVLLQVAGNGTGAERVAPGLVTVAGDAYGPTLSPDGRTMYFTLRADRKGHENIVVTDLVRGRWSRPVVVRFSGKGLDKEPYLSPDGSRLFFASRREYPSKQPAQGEEAYDLFVVGRRGDQWGTPEPLTGVNSGVYDNYPAVAANGNLYFASHRRGGKGGNDLWLARRVGGGWQTPQPVSSLNTRTTDADPYIAPDERYLIFSSDRPGGAGQGDLYISYRDDRGWSEAVSLGAVVNTPEYEYTPWVTADGKWLYFSRGWGEIWRVETRRVPALNRSKGLKGLKGDKG